MKKAVLMTLGAYGFVLILGFVTCAAISEATSYGTPLHRQAMEWLGHFYVTLLLSVLLALVAFIASAVIAGLRGK